MFATRHFLHHQYMGNHTLNGCSNHRNFHTWKRL
jgi:hypothetical protein